VTRFHKLVTILVVPRACFFGCSIVTRFWENVSRFSACWARLQDKVSRTLNRTHQTCHDLAKRDTILTAEDCYIRHSLAIFWISLIDIDHRELTKSGVAIASPAADKNSRLKVLYLIKRDTILTAEDCYINVSLQILKESLKREKLGLQRR